MLFQKVSKLLGKELRPHPGTAVDENSNATRHLLNSGALDLIYDGVNHEKKKKNLGFGFRVMIIPNGYNRIQEDL